MSRTWLWAIAVAALSCTPPAHSPKFSGNAASPAHAASSSAPNAFGQEETDLPPLTAVEPDEVKSLLVGPAALYGVSSGGLGRPSAPGRHGDLLLAIDTPYQIFGRSGSYLHIAAWRSDGAPAADARVFIDRDAVGRTDASGTLVFRSDQLEGKEAYETRSLFVIDDARHCGAVSFNPYQRTQTFSMDRLYVYTDRGVFQPGETVHVRAIGWRLKEDYAPLAAASIEFLLRTDDRHTVGAATAVTDDFGVTATDLRIPDTAEPGIYQLRVAYGTERAETALEVRRFAPPALRIEHTLGRFLLNDRARPLSFQVSVHPPAGQKLKWANVEAVAIAPGQVIGRVSTKATDDAPHELTFTGEQIARLIAATPAEQLARIEISVRDDLGREERLVRELRVTASPYVAVLELDRDDYAPGDPVSVVARVSDRNSVPLRNQPLELAVPGRALPLTSTTDARGIAKFSLTMPDASPTVALSVPGGAQRIAETALSRRDPSPMRTELGSPVVKERRSTSVAAFFPLGYAPVERSVHMDITDTSGAIIGSKLLPVRLENGKFVARGDFQAPSWGSMLLTFFALGQQRNGAGADRDLGLLVGGQSLVVESDRELTVTLEGLPATMTPGGLIDVRARVRDPRGREPDVTVGAALVDRNILGLRDPLETTPMDRFYDPTLRTLSTTGGKMLTWPVVTRNWGNENADIALPPFDWKTGGSIHSCREYWDEEDYASVGEEMPALIGSAFGVGGGGLGEGTGMGSRVVITIRTRFPATALWEPHLRGKGSIPIRGQLPDSIGEQELIVVASDKQGGVGLVRQAVQVTQPVFVEADLPAPAVAGDEVWLPVVVHNLTSTAASFALELTSDGAGRQSGKATVAAGAASASELRFRADSVGSKEVRVRAVGAGHDDQVVRRIDVVAGGVPVGRTQAAELSARAPARLAFDVPADAADADAWLAVDLPAVTTAFAGIEEIAQTIGDTPTELAGDLTSACLVVDLAQRLNIDRPAIAELRGRVLAAVTMIARIQPSDGGFSYWRNGKPSPFITSRVLEGLLEARRIGLPVPATTIAKTARYLAAPLASGALVDVQEIGWWEGDSVTVRTGITAEIFDVLARLSPHERLGVVGVALRKLSQRYQKYLDGRELDALAGGRALAALLRTNAISRQTARRGVERLLRQRDEGHFEPSWFHAYGGRIDATLAVLEALTLDDPSGFSIEKRDALTWILSTRRAWGSWHSETETAAALRALALVGAAPSEVASSVIVKLDGKVVHTVSIDPKDPFAAAASLSHLDLERHLSAGRHDVEVLYDGALHPTATLAWRLWQKGAGATVSAQGVTLRATGPATVQAGSPVELRVTASGSRVAGGTVVVGPSGLLELDLGALASVTGQSGGASDRAGTGRGRPIAGTRITDRGLELLVAPDAAAVSVALPFRAVRRGHGALPSVAWFSRTGGSAPSIVAPGPIAVE